MRRAHRVTTHRDILRRWIEDAAHHRQKFIEHLQELKNKCLNREISYEEYCGHAARKIKGKTAAEWIEYYDAYIDAAEQKISALGREHRRMRRTRLATTVCALFLFVAAIWFSRFALLGFVVQEQELSEATYTQSFPIEFTISGTVSWQPEHIGRISALSITGEREGNSLRLYLNDVMLMEHEAQSETGINNALNATEINSTEINATEITNHSQGGVQQTKVSPSQLEPPQTIEEIISPAGKEEFTVICNETCIASLQNRAEHVFRTEQNNSILRIYNITYIVAHQAKGEKSLPQEKETHVPEAAALIELVQGEARIGQQVHWKKKKIGRASCRER